MKKILILSAVLFAFAAAASAGPDNIEYYLPVKGVCFNAGIRSPQEFLGFDIGDRFADWGDITRYAEYLERVSDRVTIKQFGYTVERRSMYQVCITSPANQAALEQIRQDHLAVTDASKDVGDAAGLPLVVELMGTIHGNEISGAQGLLPVMYYYAVAENDDVKTLLDNTIILVVPAQNPDGMSRFATWVNSASSINHFPDRQSREYSEVQPSSRFNHYWMDLNRDWLTAQFPESKAFVRMYSYWMPNVVLDLHEMGNSKSGLYFHSPGDPKRTYNYIPEENQRLTGKISETTEEYMKLIDTPSYSGKGYDDFFIGKGACFGDIQGSVCLLHERVSTRGHLLDSHFGPAVFAEAVRNQSVGAIAVVDGANAHAREIKEYQRKFFLDAAESASADPGKGYIFNARGNRGIAFHFIENLLLHEIDVYPVKGQAGTWFVPFAQRHYYKIKGIFEDITEYGTEKFYDISTWSPARAYNLDYKVVSAVPDTEGRLDAAVLPEGSVRGGSDGCAFAFNPGEYYAPAMIAALQEKGLEVKVTEKPFKYKNKVEKINLKFPAGTIVVPAGNTPEETFNTVAKLAGKNAVEAYCLNSNGGKFDINSLKLSEVRKARTAIVCASSSFTRTGAVWYMLDKHFCMNHTLLDAGKLENQKTKLDRYDAIIFCADPSLSDAAGAKLARWVRDGGTLILVGKAHHIAKKVGGDNIKADAGKGVKGVVLGAAISNDSPLFWGYDQREIDIFKSNATLWKVDEGAEVLMHITDDPYRSGYISRDNLDRLKGTPVVAARSEGKGQIIYIQEDFAYRSYWYGTKHILTNAILFGNLL